MVYCKLQNNNKYQTCKVTPNQLENDASCIFSDKTKKCKRIQYIPKKYNKKIKTAKKATVKKISVNKSVVSKSPLKTIAKQNVVSKLVKKFDPFSRFTKGLIKYKSQVERLKESFKIIYTSDDDLVEFEIVPKRKMKISKNIKLPASYEKSVYISSGSFNSVHKLSTNTGDKTILRAMRYTTYPIVTNHLNEINELLKEAELTLRLSGLGITPKIYDIFFSKVRGGIVLVVISDLSEFGNLSDFLERDGSHYTVTTGAQMRDLSQKTINIYSRMIDNDIVCIDVKPSNMLMLGRRGNSDSLSVKIIDFDSAFCTSKKSVVKFKDMLEKVRDPKSDSYIADDCTEKHLKRILLHLTLLQVSLEPWTSLRGKVFMRYLVGDIKLKEIPDMVKVSSLVIGDQKNNFRTTFKHYYKFAHLPSGCKKSEIDIETALIGGLALSIFGDKFKSNNCLP